MRRYLHVDFPRPISWLPRYSGDDVTAVDEYTVIDEGYRNGRALLAEQLMA